MNFTKYIRYGLVALAIATSSSVAGLADEMPDPIRVGVDAHFKPSAFIDADGALVGFHVDIMIAVGEQLDIPVEFVQMAWDGIIPALQSSRIDTVAMAITPQRAEVVDFTNPVTSQQVVAVVKTDDADPTIEDMANLRVGVLTNSSAASDLAAHEDIKPIFYNNIIDEYNDLILGRLDVVVVESSNGSYTIHSEYPDTLRVADTQISTALRMSGFAVRQESPVFLESFNGALDALKADGTLSEILIKWYGSDNDLVK